MKHLLFIFLIFSLGCKEQTKDNYDLNKELQQTKAEVQRLERLNDSLSEQLDKCNNFVETMLDN